MTDWDQRWLAGETPWDHGEASPPLREYLERPEVSVAGMRVLVPGCGSGHDVRLLASHGAEVLGLDLSPTAVEVARRHPAAGAERYAVGDFTRYDGGPFDGIWEHTCFCAIDPGLRGAYAEAAARLLRPGGTLVGVFYLDPWDDDEEPSPPPYGVDRQELLDLFGPQFELAWHGIPERAYPGREGREWLAEFRRPGPDRSVAVSPEAG